MSIGFVSSRLSASHDMVEQSTASVATGRIFGARAAMLEAGLDWSHVPIVQCRTSSLADGEQGAHTLLDHAPDLTAVVVLADLLAEGVQVAARDRGLSLPRDLSIVGFDDIAPAAADLTSIRQPHRDKGRTAADMLLEMIDNPSLPEGQTRNRLLPTELIVRGSTAPPRTS